MKEKGVKIFGVEDDLALDLVYLTDEYPTHRACAETGITHYENLNNLKYVVNRRFYFYAFPLRLVPAAGSPARVVGYRRGLSLDRTNVGVRDGERVLAEAVDAYRVALGDRLPPPTRWGASRTAVSASWSATSTSA